MREGVRERGTADNYFYMKDLGTGNITTFM